MSAGRRARIGGRAAVSVPALVLAGAVAYALTANPLEFADTFWSSGAPLAPEPGQTDDPDARESSEFRYVDGGQVAWGLNLRNPLAVPVRIRGLQAEPPGVLLTTDTELHVATTGAPDAPSVSAPTDLAPGESVFLVVTERFSPCAFAHPHVMPGTSQIRETIPLAVSILGLDRVVDVKLPYGIQYDGPAVGDCPG